MNAHIIIKKQYGHQGSNGTSYTLLTKVYLWLVFNYSWTWQKRSDCVLNRMLTWNHRNLTSPASEHVLWDKQNQSIYMSIHPCLFLIF